MSRVRTRAIIVQPMLEEWLRAAANEVGVDDCDPALLGDEAIQLLLDLAREAAHNVARPAAPLTTFVAGLALGRTGGGVDELRALVDKLVVAAQSRPPGDDDSAP